MRERKQALKLANSPIVTHVICDLCGRETYRTTDDLPESGNWVAMSGEIHSITIVCKQGFVHDDNSEITYTIIDLCPDCFQNRLLPWLRGQGVVPTVMENDDMQCWLREIFEDSVAEQET